MKMQNDKLLPCPFCGYHGTLHSIDMCNTVYAVCMKCGSRTMDFEKGEEAIKHWNTRKPMERIVEQLEERRNTTICKMNNEPYGNQVQMWYRTGVRDAIDIVKGGVDNAG